MSKVSNVVDNDDFKKLCMINSLSNSMLLMLRYQVLVHWSPKKKYDSYEQCLEKKIEDVDRKDTQC